MRLKWLIILFAIVSFLNATEANRSNVTKLYAATFNRAPDKTGLDYWVDSGFTLEDIAISFFDQKETQEKYPEGYNLYDFVIAIYGNLFDRYPDQDGGDYWVESLSNGSVTKSVFILAVMNGAQGDDAEILNNKKEVGLAFADTGSDDIQVAKDVMANITADSSSTASAMDMIDKLNGSTPTDPVDENLPDNIKAGLDEHNRARAEVYSGSELRWSETLANSSQAYADELAASGEFKHDPNNNSYGENLAASTADMSFKYATELWNAEKSDYDYSSNSCAAGAKCGHYTQIIWKNTTEVGCASATYLAGDYAGGTIVVCRYNPPGNYIGQRPY
jgi:uncharacterized protein YkwD